MTCSRTAPAIVTGILFLTATATLPLQPAFGEGGARRDVVGHAAALVAGAESAGPASLSKQATIMDREGTVVRKGTNGWVCVPGSPDTGGMDPMCMDKPWTEFVDAVKNKRSPAYTQVGIAYMLQGDRLVSNTDPFTKERKPGEDWVEGLGAHIMVLIPDQTALKNIPTGSKNGGPWVMWSGTPYAHIMIPIDSYPAQ